MGAAMSAHAAPAAGTPTLVIRGRPYPVLLPKLSDPRLHLAAVITTLQVLGQVAFHFRLSIAQILLSLLTCAVLEVGIAARRHHVILWPASALLTGNGVAFILRVPGTQHGDWWSLRGWWIFVATAAVSLLSKHLIQWRGSHVFNPSNIGLVLCFLVLGRSRAEPLDFWWGPMSPWLGFAFAVIVAGGLVILSRLRLLGIAVGFWLSFAAGIGVLAASGHTMVARWHLGPISGSHFWAVLLTSPEILVFLFFMLTDPKTTPRGRVARVVYGSAVGLLAALMIAPLVTEWATKVAVLGALTIVCLLRPLLERVRLGQLRIGYRRLAVAGVAGLAVYSGVLVVAGSSSRSSAAAAVPSTNRGLPAITIEPSHGVSSALDEGTARLIARDLVSGLSRQSREQLRAAAGKPVKIATARVDRLRLWLVAGKGQNGPTAVAKLAGVRQLISYEGKPPTVIGRSEPIALAETVELTRVGPHWSIRTGEDEAAPPPAGPPLPGYRLQNVAARVGLQFRQGSFRFGVTSDQQAMMGGGLCWLDYDNDGWLDLFVVNSYTDDQLPNWEQDGGLPRSALFHNEHGRFVSVTARSGAGLRLRGEGCVAADFDGDGRTDLYVTTSTNDVLLWNNGDGTCSEGARKAGVVSFGWHSGAAVSDVNGDGRPDLFVAGYANMLRPIPGSDRGFPSNYEGVRDLLFLNEGGRRFREVGVQAGLDRAPYDHSLGATFSDLNSDGRPDLYVANDEDPNRLYLNEKGGPLGFRFVNSARAAKVADPNAGMGIALADYSGDGLPDLFVSNSRGQTHAAYLSNEGEPFTNVRSTFAAALGANFTGWGDSWIDLNNDGKLDLVLANGAIPVTNVAKDAGPIQVLAQRGGGRFVNANLLQDLRVNGRGIAAADYDNDGRVDIAVGSIGGKLLLLRNTSPKAHWLEVSVQPFSPGAVVTVVLPNGRRLVREVQAGSSYLSSEDPRLHFGLGRAAKVARVTVRYPHGSEKRLADVRADRVVGVSR